jgi:hypothetical protein
VLVMALAALVLMGIMGLAVDLSRLYVTKNELQNFAYSSAVAAALKLDGTNAGFTAATNAATSNSNRMAFGTENVSNVTVKFSTMHSGGFTATPAGALGYRFVEVVVAGNAPLYFMPMLAGSNYSYPVGARAVSGHMPLSGVGDGVFPFSPDAHNKNDPNFGYLLGKQYTMRWDKATGNPPAGTYLTSIDGNKLVGCPGDMANLGFMPGESGSSERGYIDLGDRDPLDAGGGASLIRKAVLGQISFNLTIVPYNYYITPEPGAKQTITDAMLDRVVQDTDHTTDRYYTTSQTAADTPSAEEMNNSYRSAYNGNRRRIVVSPVNDRDSGLVIGFGGFYLPNVPCAQVTVGNKKYDPCCGEYIGSVLESGGGSPGTGANSGAFRVVLYQ